jgi:hypothetical protein
MRLSTTLATDRLSQFLAPLVEDGPVSLYIPRFSDGHTELPDGTSLHYRGGLFSDRDVRAALRIHALLLEVVEVDDIAIRYDRDFLEADRLGRGGFVFGSKSSAATRHLLSHSNAGDLFSLEYDDEWRILWTDGTVCSLPDPSELREGEYLGQRDYGVLARLTNAKTGARSVLVAGLGSRATQGAAAYLASAWSDLYDEFGAGDFAVLLEFEPPLDTARPAVLRSQAHALPS